MNYRELQKSLLSPGSLITDLSGHEGFFHDETIYRGKPSAVLIAESEVDLVTAVRFCHKYKIPITTRGAGTGLSGGCVPSENALVISTVRLNSLKIDSRRKIAFCGPGVITKSLQDEASRYGLTYPPDPASYEESTLGGNVAENAGGLRCKRFGVTKDYILGLKAITADGNLLKTGLYNDNRGFLLGDLLVASEGTLAVITEIAVRLIPLPGPGTTLLVSFNDPEKAAQTVADIISKGIIPNVLEYIDRDAVQCAVAYEKTEGIDDKAAAILLIETSDIYKTNQTSSIRRICEKNGSTFLQSESNPDASDHLWRVRRNVSNAAKAIAKEKISEDVAVPISKFPLLVAYISEMNRESPLRINSYGHAGDGNLHVNILSLTGDPEETTRIDELVERLLKKALELGGTISGEHGIGLAKKDFLNLEFDSPTLEVMRSVKSVFDPGGILNPEKLFPDKN